MKQYRPEIDGLRALAILSVVLYHLNLTFFSQEFLPGGFLGVDIFFVISGYLISKQILNEYVEYQSFSFVNFYLRRARRILPVLFSVIIIVAIFAYFVLYKPSDIENFSLSALLSVFYRLLYSVRK